MCETYVPFKVCAEIFSAMAKPQLFIRIVEHELRQYQAGMFTPSCQISVFENGIFILISVI